MDNIQQELARLKQEIRDLKTAQTQPGTSTLHRGQGTLPAGDYSGTYTWTIHYEDVGSTDAPVTSFSHGSGWSLRPYDSTTNTQKIEMHVSDLTTVQDTLYAYSTRPITSITKD